MSEIQIESPIWQAIMADPALESARRKLSFHEIRLIIKHATGEKHDFWGAGEPDCPREIKAGNGELHTLRCKKCGLDRSWRPWRGLRQNATNCCPARRKRPCGAKRTASNAH